MKRWKRLERKIKEEKGKKRFKDSCGTKRRRKILQKGRHRQEKEKVRKKHIEVKKCKGQQHEDKSQNW